MLTSIDFGFVNNIRRATSQREDRSPLCWTRQAYNDNLLCVLFCLPQGRDGTQLVSTAQRKIDLLMTIDRLWVSAGITLVDICLSREKNRGVKHNKPDTG